MQARCKSRRGITLIEVLISMFVLMIGLLGVGAMIPAGRYEIMQGVKADYGAMVGREAFRDMKARGYLDPTNWRDVNNNVIFTPPASFSPPAPWVIDPLGLGAGFLGQFPYGTSAPTSMSRIYPNQFLAGNKPLMDAMFRCPDDLATQPDTRGRDAPPFQQTVPFNVQPWAPTNLPLLTRASAGNYSWIATIVPDTTMPSLDSKMTVSVAVFYKRNLSVAGASEGVAGSVRLPTPGVWSGEIILNYPAVNGVTRPVRPGEWMMLAGSGGGGNYFRWYRVQSAAPIDPSSGDQSVTLHGPDWNPSLAMSAWLFDGIVSVYEKNIRLELN
jgi:hypothetical protein